MDLNSCRVTAETVQTPETPSAHGRRTRRLFIFSSLLCLGLLPQLSCTSDDSVAAGGVDAGFDARIGVDSGGNDAGNPGVDAGTLPAPKTTVLVGSTLVSLKKQLASGGTAAQQAALARLLQAADGFLSIGPWSVVDKQTTPRSNDKHDYMSQAPYWWPHNAHPPSDPGTPGDCNVGFYVQHDGIRNSGEIDPPVLTDRFGLHTMIDGVFVLALAWFYTGDARYAARAETFARHWFLDRDTAMNPNMNFGQGIPCQPKPTFGRGTGIIELSGGYLSDLLDGLAILDLGAPGWTSTDQAGMRDWLSRFLTWLTAKQAADAGWADPSQEATSQNNHQSWFDSSVASLGAYLGQVDTVTAAAADGKKLIDDQIDSNGAQYRELARTQAWHYSIYNATALCRLAETANQFGTNLWSYKNDGGGTLALGMDFFVGGAERGPNGFALNPDCPDGSTTQSAATALKCSPPQVTTVPGDGPDAGYVPAFDQTEPFYELHATASEANDPTANGAVRGSPAPGGVDMWPLIPSCRIVVAPAP